MFNLVFYLAMRQGLGVGGGGWWDRCEQVLLFSSRFFHSIDDFINSNAVI